MENIGFYLSVILLVYYAVGVGWGFDLRRPYGWSVVLSGFLIGIVGYVEDADLASGLMEALALVTIAILGGPLMLRRRIKYRE